MRKRMKRLCVLLSAVMMLSAASVTAYATETETVQETTVIEEQFTDETQAETSEEESGEAVITRETVAEFETDAADETTEDADSEDNSEKDSEEESDSTEENYAFTVDGNGTVVDNVVDESSGKEFYTIQTANNNTFFLIIDYDSSSQNVYMLSMIDENDLADFLSEETEDGGTGLTTATVVLEEESATTETDAAETAVTSETGESGTSNNSMATLLILAVLGALIAGAYYYFKIYKPKHDGSFSDDETSSILTRGETVNEDENEKMRRMLIIPAARTIQNVKRNMKGKMAIIWRKTRIMSKHPGLAGKGRQLELTGKTGCFL